MSNNQLPADVQKYMEEIKFGQLWARHSLLVNRLDVGKYRIDMIGLRGAVAEALSYLVADKTQPGPRWVKASERLPGWGQKVRWRLDGIERKVNDVLYMANGESPACLPDYEWYDEQPATDSKSEPKWVKGALQWAKETIDFAWDYVKVPESLTETWGNMYMNTMNAIQEAQRETEMSGEQWVKATDTVTVKMVNMNDVEKLQQLAISLRLKGDRLVSVLRSLRLSVTAHPHYTGQENAEWTDLVNASDEAILDWLEKKEPDGEKEGLEWLYNDHIEFCYRHPDGRVEVRYRRVEGTPECNAMIKEVEALIEKAKPEVSPYFYIREAKAKEQVVIRNNSNAFRHWVADIKGYPFALLGHFTGVWLPEGVTSEMFESEWEQYEKANNPAKREVKGGGN